MTALKIGPNNPGNRGKGRPKGARNKTTTMLKDAILQAARAAGGGGDEGLARYLQTQANENPGPFMALLGKVLPMDMTSSDGSMTPVPGRIELVAPDADGDR